MSVLWNVWNEIIKPGGGKFYVGSCAKPQVYKPEHCSLDSRSEIDFVHSSGIESELLDLLENLDILRSNTTRLPHHFK